MPPVAQVQIGTATLADGDPTNEINAVAEGVSQLGDAIVGDDGGAGEVEAVSELSDDILQGFNWLDSNQLKIDHIMAEKHHWELITELTGNNQVDYETVREILTNGFVSNMPHSFTSPTGYTITRSVFEYMSEFIYMEFSTSPQGLSTISDAWVITTGNYVAFFAEKIFGGK